MYKLCVFAGTTEGRRLVELLADAPVEVTACVATEYGEALLTPRDRLTVSHRRLTEEEMEALLARERFDLVVDATHPYAAEVTENIAQACRGAGVEYLRLLREADAPPEGAVYLPDTESAVNWLAETEGNILLTTGSKELAKYAALPGFARRVCARVLPMEASLSACRAAGRPFMVVTQMLASMEQNPVPTRAEVGDIFNAVLDGAASVMLTGETAVGRYPVEAMRYLVHTVREAEAYLTR